MLKTSSHSSLPKTKDALSKPSKLSNCSNLLSEINKDVGIGLFWWHPLFRQLNDYAYQVLYGAGDYRIAGFFSSVLNFVLFVLLRLRTNIFHRNNLPYSGFSFARLNFRSEHKYRFSYSSLARTHALHLAHINYSCGKYSF